MAHLHEPNERLLCLLTYGIDRIECAREQKEKTAFNGHQVPMLEEVAMKPELALIYSIVELGDLA
jgi:hypothetical protein